MNGLGWMIRKELAVFFADRQGALLQVLIPVLLAGLVGMLFAGGQGGRSMTLLVADADGGRAVHALVGRIAADESLTVTHVDAATARARVAHGEAPAALIIPAGTSQALTLGGLFTGAHAEVTLLQDPSHAFEGGYAIGRIQEALMRELGAALTDPEAMRPALLGVRAVLDATGQQPALRALVEAGLTLVDTQPEALSELGGAQPGVQLPLSVRTEDVAGEGGPADYNSYAHTFAGMLAMFLMFTGLAAAKGLVEERERGALVRLRLAPVPRWTILAGVGGAAALVALLISILVYLVGLTVFDIEVRGSWLGLGAVLVGQSLFVGGFALLLAGLGRTTRQIDGLGTFAVLVMSFTGGAWLPSFLMPDWLGSLALALPTRWATDGLAAMTWRGLDPAVGWTAAGVLTLFGLGLGLLGVRTFRWE